MSPDPVVAGLQRAYERREARGPRTLPQSQQSAAPAPSYAGTERVLIGIDPGLSGGIAFLDSTGELIATFHAEEYTTSAGKQKRPSGADLANIIRTCGSHTPMAYVERAQSMPGQGGVFNYGTGYGVILGTLDVLGIPFELVSPAVWKRQAQLSKDKDASRHAAMRLFPEHRYDFKLKKSDGRAEAALIARYGWLRRSP